MSFAATFNALQVSNVTPGQKLVLAAIASFERAGKAWPSIATIAKRCSMGARTVQRHIASLISLGYIERIYRTGRSAITRVFIGETHAKLAPPPTPNWHPESVIPESVNEITAAPASPPPETASAAIVVSEKIPELPIIPDVEMYFGPLEPLQAVHATYPLAEVTQVVIEPSTALMPESKANEAVNEVVDTLAIDVLADVPKTLLQDLGEVRKAKKKPAKPTKTEANLWWAEAQKAGWTMEQVILTMVLRGWSRFDASWVQHVPQQATVQGRDAVFVPEVTQPASPGAIARFKEAWARQKAQMLADSARRREEQMARRR